MTLANIRFLQGILLGAILFMFSNCKNMATNFKGTRLSQTELFSVEAWKYSTGNLSIMDNNTKVSSSELNIADKEKDIVFLLKDDKKVFFKRKEDSSYVFENGSWEFNSKDSLIKINFSDRRSIEPIYGKLLSVTNTDLIITQKSEIDSNDKANINKHLLKVITIWYSHNP